MPAFIDLTGQVFGRLTVIRRATNDAMGRASWQCMCACKEVKIIKSWCLRTGYTQSCGCLARELSAERTRNRAKHGQARLGKVTPEYRACIQAKHRCECESCDYYGDYGGRGIKFLFKSFEDFYAEVGKRPSRRHSLDRKNNDGNYELGNVRWATRSQQQRNKRRYKHPVKLKKAA